MTTITRMLLPAPSGPLNAIEVRPDDAPWPPTAIAVLVPGSDGATEDFLRLMEILADAGYRTFAVDQRGQHEASAAGDPAAPAITALAKDLEVAVTAQAARRPVHLVGHGLGGLIAAHSCVAAPEMSLSLTLIDAARLPVPHAELTERGLPVLACTGVGPSPHLDRPEALAALLTAFWSGLGSVQRYEFARSNAEDFDYRG